MTELDKIVTLCAMVRALRQTADLSDVRKRLRAYERAELNLGEIVLLDLDERAMWIASIERTLMRRPVGTTARSPLL